MKNIFTRRIAIILVLIFVFGSAIFLYLFALKVDRKYSDLIIAETENTENINKITYNISYSRILLSNILYSSNTDSVAAFQKQWESCISTNAATFDTLSKKIFLPEKNKNELYNISRSEKNYTGLCREFFELKHNAGNDSLMYVLRIKILPAYKTYLDNLTTLLELNNKKLIEISDQLTIENKNTGLIYLSMGISPFAFLVVYLSFGIFLLLYIAFLTFRHDKE